MKNRDPCLVPSLQRSVNDDFALQSMAALKLFIFLPFETRTLPESCQNPLVELISLIYGIKRVQIESRISGQFYILFLLKAVEYKYLLQNFLSECTITFKNDAESCLGKIKKYLHVLRVDFLFLRSGLLVALCMVDWQQASCTLYNVIIVWFFITSCL